MGASISLQVVFPSSIHFNRLQLITDKIERLYIFMKYFPDISISIWSGVSAWIRFLAQDYKGNLNVTTQSGQVLRSAALLINVP
jgi:hypothetical protein